MATLDDILLARDLRCERQRQLLQEVGPSKALCQLTVVPPGADKLLSGLTLRLGREGLAAVMDSALCGPLCHEALTAAGYEALWIAPLSPLEAKRIAVCLEDTHPHGRVFDIDVLQKDGTPIEREDIGHAPRRCYLCNEPAKVCARSRAHSIDELLQAFLSLTS